MSQSIRFAVALSTLALPSILVAQPNSDDRFDAADESILVLGEREKEARQRINHITEVIVRDPRIDQPIARQYDAICIGILGMSAEYAEALIWQMEDNARALKIRVAPEGCRVNTLVAFVENGQAEVEGLRKSAPWLFETLRDYEFKRILNGNNGTYAWHSTKVKEVDGKDFTVKVLKCFPSCPPREVYTADPFMATRMAQQIRVDMIGSVVIIEKSRVPGKTVRQLADYVSMRSFASVNDIPAGEPHTTPTILSLFNNGGLAPDGLSPFDWSYLKALYNLPRTARGSQIHDATWSAYRKRALKLNAEPSSDE